MIDAVAKTVMILSRPTQFPNNKSIHKSTSHLRHNSEINLSRSVPIAPVNMLM